VDRDSGRGGGEEAHGPGARGLGRNTRNRECTHARVHACACARLQGQGGGGRRREGGAEGCPPSALTQKGSTWLRQHRARAHVQPTAEVIEQLTGTASVLRPRRRVRWTSGLVCSHTVSHMACVHVHPPNTRQHRITQRRAHTHRPTAPHHSIVSCTAPRRCTVPPTGQPQESSVPVALEDSGPLRARTSSSYRWRRLGSAARCTSAPTKAAQHKSPSASAATTSLRPAEHVWAQAGG
jgi:hypothetical protein